MGEIVLAAKITHVPSMIISEQPGPHNGCRDAAINGLKKLGDMARELDVDTFVVLDTHWLVNAAFHINGNRRNEGVYTSHEFPHFIQNLGYDYTGNPELSHAIAEKAVARGINAMSHEVPSLDLEYGTIVPMRYMNEPGDIKVVSVAAWCTRHELKDSRRIGEAIAEAVKESDSRVALLASGSLSHLIWENRLVDKGLFTISSEFNKQMDLRVLDLWKQGDFKTFLKILPEYAEKCDGEGGMHDTAMLFGALGWDQYEGRIEMITPYFESSGTGQVNVLFEV
ncbi:3,4-dihydroxyphenylacetate 2,3-dioxygenase [Endozoicomonas lisbonensis]|uniref:3,4-dihydroxyphenylacetate 2,3-dioxygenase n=1 Tax=Endozoicomonas lisbonensis TaxID=3120522 RepID=UPI003391B56A